ncbi:probable serine/threonine-protein kinase MARK-C isoform X2 [Toxorhynchites rutilus septentrionalis]|uniref:probable serine/threonine-protein kinase MARK-C isoform X2 n=1 Tax=Toxorhynchites rutilus septentrionalis TaxID=329112 RepID=UPI00247A2EC7|nr:probable serine/threonine-protein kinase MARK-C isoform X2 [Toxorhynchites rutilus septentrionalis]
MIRVDETDPLGDVPPAFPYREVQIERGVDAKQLFELSTEIGRGKFGVVHICKEKSTGTRLAAKFIQIVKKGDRRNIEREVHMMNVLHHSKIAQLYAAYEYDRTFCMVMELVEGGELFDRVLDEKFILTEKACAIFMRQICDAIAYIHGNNVVHLDLKPENILCLTESGNRIKIIDFGLAREYDPDNKLQVLFGTPEFVAPEVVNFEAISFATDMWSVGVIAYVLVSGLSPFAGEDDIQTMGNITIGRYDFLDEAFDTVSEEAIDFINRCLVKEQKERLTAEEALKHKWIKRKPQYYPTNRRPSITFKPILLENNNNTVDAEIDKENLKELVSKWNESPNNRYAFEQATESVISPSGESLQIRRLSADANGRRGSLARGDEDPLLLSPSSSTSCCSSSSPLPSELSATNLPTSDSYIAPPPTSALRPALAPLEIVSNTIDHGSGPCSSEISNNNSSLNRTPSATYPPHGMSSSDHSRPSSPDHSQPHQTQETITGGQPVDAVRPTLAKEEPWSESHQPLSPQTTPQQPDSTLNTGSPVTPLSPTLSTADLDSDLESLKSKIKIKTSKAQIKLNELAQKPDFLSNDTIKPQTFKFLPKSISLCSDDSVFKENYTKFCDRNAAPKVPEIRESSNEASQEVTTTTTKTTTQDAPEGTKVIVTKTTRSSKTSADGTKTVTVRKTIVKQKKIIEEDSEKSKLKPPMINSNVSQEAATVKRTKFRVNQMSSRDVPVAMNSVAKRYLELNRLISTESSTLPTDDLLMKKLHKHHISSHFQQQTSSAETEAMNNLKNNTMKYRSLSVDWDAMDAVENRSMKSINSFLKRTTTTTASSAVKQIQAQIEASIHK